MKRTALLAALVSAALVGSVLAWNAVRREAEFRRLIAFGDAELAREQTFVAIEAFSGALALKPDSMLAHLKRGDSYRRRGELTAAVRDLRDAAALDPTATRPQELLGDVHVALAEYDRAIDHYMRFIQLDDRSPRVLYKLAVTYFKHGQAAGAIEPLRQAVAIEEKFTEAHYLLGMCLRAGRRTADAQRALRRAVELNPAFSPAREELADLLTSLGRPREGIEQLEALAAIEPARAERMVGVGLAYARLGRTDAAILTLSRAAERYPDASAVYTALGRVWLESAEARNDRVALSKAIEALQPLVSRATATSETLALYGRALYLTGDPEGAHRVLRQATERLPVDRTAFLHLSAAAERLGELSIARDALVDYLSLADDGDKTQALSAQIAHLSLRMDDASTALTWAQRAVDRESQDAFALGLLAEAQWRTGQQEAARETLTRALGREPRNRALLRLGRTFGLRRGGD